MADPSEGWRGVIGGVKTRRARKGTLVASGAQPPSKWSLLQLLMWIDSLGLGRSRNYDPRELARSVRDGATFLREMERYRVQELSGLGGSRHIGLSRWNQQTRVIPALQRVLLKSRRDLEGYEWKGHVLGDPKPVRDAEHCLRTCASHAKGARRLARRRGGTPLVCSKFTYKNDKNRKRICYLRSDDATLGTRPCRKIECQSGVLSLVYTPSDHPARSFLAPPSSADLATVGAVRGDDGAVNAAPSWFVAARMAVSRVVHTLTSSPLPPPPPLPPPSSPPSPPSPPSARLAASATNSSTTIAGADEWTVLRRSNCYDGQGGIGLGQIRISYGQSKSDGLVRACQERCSIDFPLTAQQRCTAVTVLTHPRKRRERSGPNCFFRKDVQPSRCKLDSRFDTYTRKDDAASVARANKQ